MQSRSDSQSIYFPPPRRSLVHFCCSLATCGVVWLRRRYMPPELRSPNLSRRSLKSSSSSQTIFLSLFSSYYFSLPPYSSPTGLYHVDNPQRGSHAMACPKHFRRVGAFSDFACLSSYYPSRIFFPQRTGDEAEENIMGNGNEDSGGDGWRDPSWRLKSIAKYTENVTAR